MKEFFIIIFILALLGGGGYGWYRYQHAASEMSDMRPSIAELPRVPSDDGSMNAKGNMSGEDADSRETSTPTPPDEPGTLEVKVLNGGSVGGSAGKMSTYLKSKGYTKVQTGNTNGSNTGVVVYYSEAMEDEAKVLQLVLLDEYKGVTSSPAGEAKNTDATSAPIVVILGS